ncbi:hypothetical protein V6615_15790 [Oscillospiraceae bacterium PP1C4]
MNNNYNLSQSQLNALINLAGKKMGTNPDKLREQMQNGEMNDVLNKLSPAQRAQMNNLMNNPQAVEQFLSNPNLQALLKGLMGK